MATLQNKKFDYNISNLNAVYYPPNTLISLIIGSIIVNIDGPKP